MEVKPQDFRRAGVGIQLFHSPEVSQDGGKTPGLQEGQQAVATELFHLLQTVHWADSRLKDEKHHQQIRYSTFVT